MFSRPQDVFARGIFKSIVARRISLPLPRPPPNESKSNLWISRLPESVKTSFTVKKISTFIDPLYNNLVYGRNAARMRDSQPRPRTHASPDQYAMFLERAHNSGILSWSLMSEESNDYRLLASTIQMSIFSVTKSEASDRLISWPQVQNALLPDPPQVSLPNPGLFDQIKSSSERLSAVYLDIENMFHNIFLPKWLSLLFPMQPVQASTLSPEVFQSIKHSLKLPNIPDDAMLRPLQATMPMGFKWSVYISHLFVGSCIQQSYSIIRSSRITPKCSPNLQILLKEHAPFQIQESSPLVLHIIDDITIIACNWPDQTLTLWNRVLQRLLSSAGLPIKQEKSIEIGCVEHNAITFIGCIWNLRTKMIRPDPFKVNSAVILINSVMLSRTITYHEWTRIIGKVIWMTIIHRSLLSIFNNVFQVAAKDEHNYLTPAAINEKSKRELFMISSLLPLAYVDLSCPISSFCIAFDASLVAGAVVWTCITPELAWSVWGDAQQRQQTNQSIQLHNTTIPTSSPLDRLLRSKWNTAFVHKWRKLEHINGLEAAAAVMALEWAIKKGVKNARVLFLTDSAVVLGAFSKGRSSSIPMLLRCRKFSALSLSFNIRACLIHIPTSRNPADGPTRNTN